MRHKVNARIRIGVFENRNACKDVSDDKYNFSRRTERKRERTREREHIIFIQQHSFSKSTYEQIQLTNENHHKSNPFEGFLLECSLFFLIIFKFIHFLIKTITSSSSRDSISTSTMAAGKLFTTAQGLPWIKTLKGPNDDEHADRLNHRYTVGFLLVCVFIVTTSPFVVNRITCWVPAQFVGSYSAYTNNYCWISNTYYIPSNYSIPHNKQERNQAEIGYYQWTPFIFLLAALFFYLPRMLWRSMNTRSGIDLQYLVIKSNEKKTDGSNEKSIAQLIETYCKPYDVDDTFGNRCCRTLFCTSGKRLGNYLRSVYIIVKFLYLINSLIQLMLIHIILGQPGWLYGVDIWYQIFVQNSVLTDSPYFPRVTLCDLRIREVGNLHRYTVQCVLPINMLNEKLFTLAWFWFIYVFFSNLISFLVTLYESVFIRSRISFIRNLYRTSVSDSHINEDLIENFTQNHLMQDGVLILEILWRNGSAICASQVVNRLLENYIREERIKEERKLRPDFNDTDV